MKDRDGTADSSALCTNVSSNSLSRQPTGKGRVSQLNSNNKTRRIMKCRKNGGLPADANVIHRDVLNYTVIQILAIFQLKGFFTFYMKMYKMFLNLSTQKMP